MIISKLYMLFTAGPQIWSWLVYLEQQTIFGMTPMVRGDTLNGIVEATEKEKIIQFKKKKKKAFENDRYIVNDLDHVALFVKQKKGELACSHSFLFASFVDRTSELSEFIYSARRLQPKELSSIDFLRTKISHFWLTENTN